MGVVSSGTNAQIFYYYMSVERTQVDVPTTSTPHSSRMRMFCHARLVPIIRLVHRVPGTLIAIHSCSLVRRPNAMCKEPANLLACAPFGRGHPSLARITLHLHTRKSLPDWNPYRPAYMMMQSMFHRPLPLVAPCGHRTHHHHA